MQITRYLSNEMILREIGSRLKDQRIARFVTQEELSQRSGLSPATIMRIESGKGCSLNALISVCQVLGLTENLDHLIPEYQERPTDILDQKPKRQRASKPKQKQSSWTWEEDKAWRSQQK